MWLAHPMIVDMARCDPAFRGRLRALRAAIVAADAEDRDVTVEDAAGIANLPYPVLAAIFVEHVLTQHPGAIVAVLDAAPIDPKKVN